jgi:hypothetical protein
VSITFRADAGTALAEEWARSTQEFGLTFDGTIYEHIPGGGYSWNTSVPIPPPW